MRIQIDERQYNEFYRDKKKIDHNNVVEKYFDFIFENNKYYMISKNYMEIGVNCTQRECYIYFEDNGFIKTCVLPNSDNSLKFAYISTSRIPINNNFKMKDIIGTFNGMYYFGIMEIVMVLDRNFILYHAFVDEDGSPAMKFLKTKVPSDTVYITSSFSKTKQGIIICRKKDSNILDFDLDELDDENSGINYYLYHPKKIDVRVERKNLEFNNEDNVICSITDLNVKTLEAAFDKVDYLIDMFYSDSEHDKKK